MRLWAFALAITVMLPAPVFAETAGDKDAKTFYQSGAQHYERGQYAKAIEEFQEAYRLSKRAALLYNIAQSYEKLGDLVNARDYFQKYLDSGDAEAAEVGPLRDKIASLETRIAEKPAASAAPAPSRPFRIWKWVAMGATLVFAGGATYFALDASNMEKQIEDAQGMGRSWDDYKDKQARGERDVVLAWASGGVAVVTLGVWIYTAWADVGDAKAERAFVARGVSFAPTLAPDRVGMALLWHF